MKIIKRKMKYFLEKGYKVRLFPHTESDKEVMKNLKKSMNSENIIVLNLDLDNILTEYVKCDFFIGMRLHSIIFSYMTNTGFLALSYDDKVKRFCKYVIKRTNAFLYKNLKLSKHVFTKLLSKIKLKVL